MTTWVSYQGKNLGIIELSNGRTKEVFIAKSLETLTQLFQIKPDELIEVEGHGEIHYSKFKRDTLSRIASYYPTFDHWRNKDAYPKPGI